MKKKFLPLILITLIGCFAVNDKKKKSMEIDSAIEKLTRLQVICIMQQDSLDKINNISFDKGFINRHNRVKTELYFQDKKVKSLAAQLTPKEELNNDNGTSSGN